MPSLSVWHFAGETLWDGSPLPKRGDVLSLAAGERPILCKQGYHGNVHVIDALGYARGCNVCRRCLTGTIISDQDKACSDKAVQETDYVNVQAMLVEFARWCAERAKQHAATAAEAARRADNCDRVAYWAAYAAVVAANTAKAARWAASCYTPITAPRWANGAAHAARWAAVAAGAATSERPAAPWSAAIVGTSWTAEAMAQEAWLATRLCALLGVAAQTGGSNGAIAS